MAIVLSRVDGRMIHGQVAIAWTRLLAVDEIIVINDEVVNDEMQKMLLEMAVPPGVTLIIAGVTEAFEILKSGELGGNTMIIYKVLHDAVRMAQLGFKTETLNIGGMYHTEGKKQYAKALFFDEHDIVDLTYLAQCGVSLFYQVAPMNNKRDICEIVNLQGV